MSSDWFEAATQGSGSVAAGFDRVICIEESRLQFVRCLKAAVLSPVPHAPDRIALLAQDIRVLDQTLQLRLGILAMDRPQAWFRHSPATERGPFGATVYEEPVFARFDEQRAVSIRHLLPQLWRSRQLACEGYDPGPSLWGRLLQINKKYGQLNQLPHPFSDLSLEELPEALPDDIASPTLLQYATQLSQRMKACQKDLEGCFQTLWSRSESFLYALHLQHLSAKARQQQGRSEDKRDDTRQGWWDARRRWSEKENDKDKSEAPPRKLSQALEDALRFMNFGSLPDFGNLRQRYRVMAHTLHPDRGGNEDKFKLLTQHYQEILSILPRS